MDLTARSDLLTSAGANKECKEGFNTKEGQVKEGMFWKESHIYRAMLIVRGIIVRGIIAKHSPISNTNRKKKLELDALNCLGEGLQV